MYDPDAGNRAIKFIEYLPHVEGSIAGQRVVLQEWQKAYYAAAYGYKKPNGTRRYHETFLFIPRKNGKTFMLGSQCCLALYADDEAGAQVYCTAAEQQQARLLWGVTRRQIQMTPQLAAVTKLYQHAIYIPSTGSTFKPLSSEASSKHGFSVHFCAMDELHTYKNGDLLEAIRTSPGTRPNYMISYITTSDFERPDSVCNKMHEYASKVRDGLIDNPYFLPIIYEASIKDDWESPKTWAKANPNMGVTFPQEFLENEVKRAKEEPSYQNSVMRLYLNVRTQQETRWIPMHKWKDCAAGVDDAMAWRAATYQELKGVECMAGLDLGSVSDLTAFALLFKREKGYLVLPWFWIPRIGAEVREKKHRIPYTQWEREGFLTFTDGEETDYDQVRGDINDLAEHFGIRKVAIDRLFQGAQLSHQLMADGHDVVAFGQGFMSMAAPSKRFIELVVGGKLEHGNNPILTEHAANAMVKEDPSGNMKPVKPKAISPQKIDGIVATIMGIGLWENDAEEEAYGRPNADGYVGLLQI